MFATSALETPECDLQECVSKTMLTSVAFSFRTFEVKWSYYFRTEGVFFLLLFVLNLVFVFLVPEICPLLRHRSDTAWTTDRDLELGI